MEAIDILKKEHEEVEQYLLDMEMVIRTTPVNYPALNHLCRVCAEFWDLHEAKEEKIFNILNKHGFNIPIKKIEFEHGELKRHREALVEAIESRSEFKVRKALVTHGRQLVDKIRGHMDYEDNFIYTFPESMFNEKTIKEINQSITEKIPLKMPKMQVK